MASSPGSSGGGTVSAGRSMVAREGLPLVAALVTVLLLAYVSVLPPSGVRGPAMPGVGAQRHRTWQELEAEGPINRHASAEVAREQPRPRLEENPAFRVAADEFAGEPPPPPHPRRARDVQLPHLAVEESHMDVHGLKVQVLRARPEGASHVSVLLYHGFAFSAETWRDIGTLSYLAGIGADAAAVSLPGHGGTPNNAAFPSDGGPPSADAAIAFLNSLVRGIGFKEEPVLVAASYSGEWAWPCLAVPTQVLGEGGYQVPPIRAVVLVAPNVKPENLRNLGTWAKLLPALIVYGDLDRRYQTGQHKAIAEAFKANGELVVLKGIFHRRPLLPPKHGSSSSHARTHTCTCMRAHTHTYTQDAKHAAYIDAPTKFHSEINRLIDRLPDLALARNGLY